VRVLQGNDICELNSIELITDIHDYIVYRRFLTYKCRFKPLLQIKTYVVA